MKNYFNPRSYKRSDESASHFWHKVIISIHAPTRGATQFLWMHLLVHLFQSTLLQEERPQDNMVMQIGKMISIHAPTRGATCQPYTPSHSCLISIHAPTRGATIIVYFFGVKLIDFNPRSYKRSDCICSAPVQNVYYFNPRSYKRSDKMERFIMRMQSISIHAPTRGATAKMHNYPYTYL